MGVSLKSIAKDLNLSIATVSWILSGQGEKRGFSDSTILQVKAHAKEVGYRPNLIAKSLSTGKTGIIALIIPSISDPFYSQMASGVEARATESGFVMVLASSEGDEKKERKLIQTLRAQQVDGIIIAPTNKSDKAITQMINENYSFVLIDRYINGLKSNYVIVDNRESCKDMVNHLLELQSKKVAFITSDTHLSIMDLRREGYIDALKGADMESDPNLIIEVNRSNYSIDIVQKLDELFRTEPDVDGFFFTTHYLAEETIKYFITKGIDYKTRFNMGSMHITKSLEMLVPNMSFAVIPIEEMGGVAVDILIDSINFNGENSLREVSVQSKRVFR